MKVSMIAERADIATGTFYHFFDSKEAYVKALLEAQDRKMQAELLPMLRKTHHRAGHPLVPGFFPDRE